MAVELAKLAYWPDFSLGFEWMPMQPRDAFVAPLNTQTGTRPPTPQLSEDGSDNWAITFGMNLPIWFDKIKAGIREARSRMSAAQHEYVAARNGVYFRIEDALARVRSQKELVLDANGRMINLPRRLGSARWILPGRLCFVRAHRPRGGTGS